VTEGAERETLRSPRPLVSSRRCATQLSCLRNSPAVLPGDSVEGIFLLDDIVGSIERRAHLAIKALQVALERRCPGADRTDSVKMRT